VGSGTTLEIAVTQDKKGAILRRRENGSGTVSTSGVKLIWDWDSDGLTGADTVRVRVFAFEMVYIPAGAFYAGDYAASSGSLKKGSADNDPWQITSESAISVTSAVTGGFYYVSAANAGEDQTGSSFSIPVAYPKAYNAFYVMKYEISEGQWLGFISTLSSEQKSGRDITSLNGKNSDSVVNRNTFSWDTLSPMTTRQDRSCSYLSWADLCALADWAALRPMTELEFEKTCRGPNASVINEYAWGNTTIVAAEEISGSEDGTENISTPGANACYNNIIFSGGDTGQGPLRGGIFATSSSSRTTSGASYYGVMELSGNLWERCVTLGNAQGRSFLGSHGDGLLTVSGYATNLDWPGIDASPVNGVTGSSGAGFKGGAWDTAEAMLKVSARSKAALSSNIRGSNYGGRCARSAP
jgi:formylglycine-generating enzyme required for sulfatase activity